jgi:hypothetical protein
MTTCGSPSATWHVAMNQLACADPLANGHRPLARKPPSTGVALPIGAKLPAI